MRILCHVCNFCKCEHFNLIRQQTGPSQSRNELHIDTRSDSSRSGNSNLNGGRDRISPQYNGSNSSRPASTSTYDIKSDSPSRKRRRVSTRQSPTSSWENRQSPRSSQNHGHQHSPLLRRRLRDQQQRSWEPLPNIFQQTPSPPHQQQQHSRKFHYVVDNRWLYIIIHLCLLVCPPG